MHRRLLPFTVVLALSSTLALADIPELTVLTASTASRPKDLESAPWDARRLPFPDDARERVRDLDAWFSATATHRVHVQLDRPLYRPGETVSVKVWDLATKGLAPAASGITVQLLDPRGTVQQTQWLATERGSASHTFTLDAGAPGGGWTVQVVAPDGTPVDRPFVVSSFQAPRVKKTLDFVREGYGPGDAVEAALTLTRATGEPLANVVATAHVQADGQALPPFTLSTDSRGEATVAFTLPAQLAKADVLLTVLVDDGGTTESISRAVPVVLDRVTVAFYPEGGDLVTSLPGRVYFEATDTNGEPVDVEGVIEDDRGRVVAALQSWVEGRGHVAFTPEPGRTYRARLSDPADLENPVIALPVAQAEGCVLHHHDDLDGAQQAVRVSVDCTDSRDVIVLASQQEQVLDRAAVHVVAHRPTTVYLRSAVDGLSGAQGVARVTVLDRNLDPLAERLVYRNKGRQLSVAITADRERYAPRDEVVLTVRTTDPDGHPVPAELALAVVDDTLLSYADDDQHGLLSRVLLQADLPEPIEGVADLFAPDAKDGGLGLDLVLGTRGWRRFDWSPVVGMNEQRIANRAAEREMERQMAAGWGAPGVATGAMMGGFGDAMEMDEEIRMEAPARDFAALAAPVAVSEATSAARGAPAQDNKKAAEKTKDVVRQFAPSLDRADDAAPRTDFRDTVTWQPAVRTGANGVTKVKFQLTDAVTGFRATAEGIGDGWLGHGDTLLASTLPFHLDARLPQQLAAGDRVLVPVTLENQRPETVAVTLGATVSPLLELGRLPDGLSLRSGERRTVHVPLTAKAGSGSADLSLTATAGSSTDAVIRQIPVVPRGFPIHWGTSGMLEAPATHAVVIPENALEGSITGRVTVFPSPVSELMEGAEGMVRMPGGCFEQTSSTNYPNILVLDWLERTGGGGKLGVDRGEVLKTGYNLLTGYQVDTGGFETFGDGPGKEALSAYGLLQFTDMDRVFHVDPKVIADNVAYLYQQRNGHGGYAITGASAHGYGTAPPEVLDAYITYALVETGHHDLPAELDAQSAVAKRSKDPYTLALSTLSLLATRPSEGKAAAARLASLQAADGSLPGSETSITRSENYNLLVEATALGALAFLRAGDLARAHQAVEWMHQNQTGPGVWGATQGNALALKAIAAVAEASARAEGPGHVEVTVDGELVAESRFEAGEREPLNLDLGPWLTAGKRTVVVTLDGGALPYALEVGWSSETPTADADRRVDLTTRLADTTVGLGETTRLTASLSNRTREVVPDPIARIGIPAGLSAPIWQLQQMKDRGEIAFFETRPREVTVYWEGLGVGEVHEVSLDLTADVPGTFVAPASSAYPYYDDQARAWVAGAEVTIKP